MALPTATAPAPAPNSSASNSTAANPYRSAANVPSFSDTAADDFPYRALSKTAVASVVMFAVGMVGWLLWPGLVFGIVGLILSVWAIRTIRAYPEEFSGGGLAKLGLVANLVLLVGGIGYHSYVYATEVPEGYTRMKFWQLQQPDGAADRPTLAAVDASGKKIFLKGYIHPTSGSGQLRRFILVPDMGTCCFGGQPKSSDMIDVTLTGGQTVQSNVLIKKLAGEFQVLPYGMEMPGFENGIFYQFKVDQVR